MVIKTRIAELTSRAPWVRNLVIHAREKFWLSRDCTPFRPSTRPSVRTIG